MAYVIYDLNITISKQHSWPAFYDKKYTLKTQSLLEYIQAMSNSRVKTTSMLNETKDTRPI